MITKILGLLATGLPKVTSGTIIKKTLAAATAATNIQSLTKIPLGQTVTVEAFVYANTSGNRGFFRVIGTAKNIGGTTTLMGNVANVAQNHEGGSLSATLVADNTKDTIELRVSADAAAATTFTGYFIVTTQP